MLKYSLYDVDVVALSFVAVFWWC